MRCVLTSIYYYCTFVYRVNEDRLLFSLFHEIENRSFPFENIYKIQRA